MSKMPLGCSSIGLLNKSIITLSITLNEELEKHLEWKEKEHEMLKKTFGIKNIKTHRSQWFD